MDARLLYVVPAKLLVVCTAALMLAGLGVVQFVTFPLMLFHRETLMAFMESFTAAFWRVIETLLLLSRGGASPAVEVYVEDKDAERLVAADTRSIMDTFAGGSTILVSNHIGAADCFVLNHVVRRAAGMDKARYIVKDSLKWVPIIGLGMYTAGFLLLKRKWDLDMERIKKWCARFRVRRRGVVLVIYPEGTRFTPKKSARSREYCEQRGLQVFSHVLSPRTKGFQLCVDSLQETLFDKVVHATVVYTRNGIQHSPPSLLSVLFWTIDGVFRVKIEREAFPTPKAADECVTSAFIRKEHDIPALAALP